MRLNLDDIETLVGHVAGTVAAITGDDTVVVWVEGADERLRRSVASAWPTGCKVHRSGSACAGSRRCRCSSNGKVDYRALERSVA